MSDQLLQDDREMQSRQVKKEKFDTLPLERDEEIKTTRMSELS